jgi:hypothetical protein
MEVALRAMMLLMYCLCSPSPAPKNNRVREGAVVESFHCRYKGPSPSCKAGWAAQTIMRLETSQNHEKRSRVVDYFQGALSNILISFCKTKFSDPACP